MVSFEGSRVKSGKKAVWSTTPTSRGETGIARDPTSREGGLERIFPRAFGRTWPRDALPPDCHVQDWERAAPLFKAALFVVIVLDTPTVSQPRRAQGGAVHGTAWAVWGVGC